MTDFGTILRHGRRRFEIKKSGRWGKCESCDERRKVYPYDDSKGQIWNLCGDCSDAFVKEEE